MKTLFLIIQRPRIDGILYVQAPKRGDAICYCNENIESATREFTRIAAGGAYRNFTYHLVSIEIASEKELASIR